MTVAVYNIIVQAFAASLSSIVETFDSESSIDVTFLLVSLCLASLSVHSTSESLLELFRAPTELVYAYWCDRLHDKCVHHLN